jgi:Mg/Co/Ni transporter MgtE
MFNNGYPDDWPPEPHRTAIRRAMIISLMAGLILGFYIGLVVITVLLNCT